MRLAALKPRETDLEVAGDTRLVTLAMGAIAVLAGLSGVLALIAFGLSYLP